MGSKSKNTPYGLMSFELEEFRLEDICVPGDGIQTGPFGSQLHNSDYVTDGTPIITVEHLGENRITRQNLPRVSDEDKARLSRYTMRAGDIIFSRVGSVDRRAIVREQENGWLFSGRCLRVRPNSKKVSPEYLSWFMGLDGFKEYIRKIAVGATMPSLNTKLLADVPIFLPSLEKQKKTAEVLDSLDDKIELNRCTNATLEAMARTLFKSWFVDFDPVRAKAAGKKTGLPKEIEKLFPSRLVKSELGEVPEGWGVSALADHFDAVRGVSYKGEGLGTEGIPMHNLNSIFEGGGYKEQGIKHYSGEYKEHQEVQPGDVIVANTEQGHDRLLIGYAAMIPARFTSVSIASHHLYRLRPKNGSPLSSAYLYRLLNTSKMHEIVSGYANGTTVNMLPLDGVQKPGITTPPKLLVEAFTAFSGAVNQRSEKYEGEAASLAQFREALLPKLVGG